MSDIPYNELPLDELLSLVKDAVFNGEPHLLFEILQAHDNGDHLRGVAVACAAKQGRLEIIQELLKNDAVISQEYRGQAVINAASEGHLAVVQELLKAVISLNDWKYALRCAVENEHIEIVREFSEHAPTDCHLRLPRRWLKGKDDFPRQ